MDSQGVDWITIEQTGSRFGVCACCCNCSSKPEWRSILCFFPSYGPNTLLISPFGITTD